MDKITKEEYELLTDEQKKQLENLQKELAKSELYEQVMLEYLKCGDETVKKWFDIDSEKNLKKKLKVLRDINAGKDVSGKDYREILELAASEDPDVIDSLI